MKEGDKGNATVKAIQSNGTFEDKQGKLKYKQEVTLELPDKSIATVEANSVTQDPPYKVGDAVTYNCWGEFKGVAKVSMQKEKGNFSPSNGSKSFQRNQASIIAQYAFREANLMLISNGYGEDVNTTSQRLDKTTALAELILEKLVVLEQKAKDNGLG